MMTTGKMPMIMTLNNCETNKFVLTPSGSGRCSLPATTTLLLAYDVMKMFRRFW